MPKITFRTDAGKLTLVDNVIRLRAEGGHPQVEPWVEITVAPRIGNPVLVPDKLDFSGFGRRHDFLHMGRKRTAHEIDQIKIIKLFRVLLTERNQLDLPSDWQT